MLRQLRTERLCCQKSCPKRNPKERPSDKKKMTPVKNFREEQEAMEKANMWINTDEHFLKTGCSEQ